MKFIIKIEVDDRLELTMEKFWQKLEKLIAKTFVWNYGMVEVTRYRVVKGRLEGSEDWEVLE